MRAQGSEGVSDGRPSLHFKHTDSNVEEIVERSDENTTHEHSTSPAARRIS